MHSCILKVRFSGSRDEMEACVYALQSNYGKEGLLDELKEEECDQNLLNNIEKAVSAEELMEILQATGRDKDWDVIFAEPKLVLRGNKEDTKANCSVRACYLDNFPSESLFLFADTAPNASFKARMYDLSIPGNVLLGTFKNGVLSYHELEYDREGKSFYLYDHMTYKPGQADDDPM